MVGRIWPGVILVGMLTIGNTQDARGQVVLLGHAGGMSPVVDAAPSVSFKNGLAAGGGLVVHTGGITALRASLDYARTGTIDRFYYGADLMLGMISGYASIIPYLTIGVGAVTYDEVGLVPDAPDDERIADLGTRRTSASGRVGAGFIFGVSERLDFFIESTGYWYRLGSPQIDRNQFDIAWRIGLAIDLPG